MMLKTMVMTHYANYLYMETTDKTTIDKFDWEHSAWYAEWKALANKEYHKFVRIGYWTCRVDKNNNITYEFINT